MSALAIAADVRNGRRPAVSVVEETITAIEERNRSLNAFTKTLHHRALARARAVDEQVAAGLDPGTLAGVPFAAKNLFDVVGESTLAGSPINLDAQPATEDADAIARMEGAGAILVGLTNMDEFAYGFTTENKHFGATRNPYDLALVAGGSSGGSAAAVAADLVPLALGSDTNGSIRVPAAFCGAFGLKPTFGRLSRRGVFPFVSDLDHVGLLAGSVADLSLGYQAMRGLDELDPDQISPPLEHSDSPKGQIRIGVLAGWFEAGCDPEILLAVQILGEHLKAQFGVEFPDAGIARSAAFCLTAARGARLHLARLREQGEKFDPAVRDRLLAGLLLPDDLIYRALEIRQKILVRSMSMFERYDVLVAPAAPFTAPPIGKSELVVGDKNILVRANAGIYTQPISFLGLPVVAAPICRIGLAPIGVQLIAAPWHESLLLSVAADLERNGLCRARTFGAASSRKIA